VTNVQQIIIPGLARYAQRQRQYCVKAGYLKDEPDEGDYDDDDPHQVLAGSAVRYNTAFELKGSIFAFEPGAFAACLASGRTVDLRLDHDESVCIADTGRGLEFFESKSDLLFRFDMDRMASPEPICKMVDSRERACASVGFQIVSERNEICAGHTVRIIEAANLVELSLVREGAISRAFAFMTDSVSCPSIRAMDKTDTYAIASAVHRIKRAATKIAETLNLSARLDRLERDAYPSRSRQTFSSVVPILSADERCALATRAH
jgi:HK97 family phage prohead protease